MSPTEEEQRIDAIDGELAAGMPRAGGAVNTVSYSWHTVEFLVRMVRKRDERVNLLLRHVTAAHRQLTNPSNTGMLDGHPAVQDARRLLQEVSDASVLDKAIAMSNSTVARIRMEAYRAGLAAAAGPEEWTPPPVNREHKTLVDGSPVTEGHAELKPNGQQKGYVVLGEDERDRGFVRPLRLSYVHVGLPGPRYPLRDLTPEEQERFCGYDYVKYEEYPQHEAALGLFWSRTRLDKVGKGCGTLTTMSLPIAETYARDPGFYGATFCCGCGTHLPVGRDGEFVWEGTDERVGT